MRLPYRASAATMLAATLCLSCLSCLSGQLHAADAAQATVISALPIAPSTNLYPVTPNKPLTLATLRMAHPRLLFTPEAEAALRIRIASDPLLAQFVDSIRLRSNAIAAEPPVPYKSVPFAEFGQQMLETSRFILERITAHGVMYRITGERVYADRMWREVETALSYPSWNPAHFLDASEMMLAMSFAYDWGYDVWTPAQRAALRTAIITRALNRGLEIHETRAGLSSRFPTATSNWNSVSNTGILAGALVMAEDEPEIARRALAYTIPSLNNPKSAYEPDGGFEEGPTYWGYGTDFYTLASAMLKSALGDDADMLNGNGIARTALYRLHVQSPTGRNYSYADCWPRTAASVAYAMLSSRFGPAPARQHVRNLLQEDVHNLGTDSGFRLMPLIVLWLPPAQSAAAFKDVPLDAFFQGRVHLSMMRSSWNDPKAAYLGFKAGSAWHGHNHLDLGSFLFDQAGVRWSADLGPDAYGLPGYFRHERSQFDTLTDDNRDRANRWSYLRINNHGHSTLTLGDDLQSRDAIAPFIAHGSTARSAFTIANLSSVYPKRASSWHRGIALKDRAWIVVRDELTGLAPKLPAEWVMMTESTVTVAADGRSALLQRDGQQMRLSLASAPAKARISAVPATPKLAGEDPNVGITRLLISWQTSATNETLEVHLVPASFKGKTTLAGALSTWTKSLPTNPSLTLVN